jgi:hypothetical protein
MARLTRLNRSVKRAETSKPSQPALAARKMAKVVALSSVRPSRTPARDLSVLESARVVAIDNGTISVEVPRLGATPLPARTIVPHADLAPDDQVIVARLGERGSELVIIGRLVDPLAPPRDVRVNGRKVSIEADSELILKCAAATIRIGRDGLIAVRGDRVTTQARGVNRIRGGSVEIN